MTNGEVPLTVTEGAKVVAAHSRSVDMREAAVRDARMSALFAVATFWAAALMFVLEPLFAKMLLPIFGGAPAVWNTSMVFFQLALLLAYIYSDRVSSQLSKRSTLLHFAVLVLVLLVLPVTITGVLGPDQIVRHPIGSLFVIATVSIGLPFFVTATTSPLLQKWFSLTNHRDAAQPYVLYAASNAGSLIGLAAYPLLLERFASSQQGLIWSAGYLIFMLLVIACGVLAVRRKRIDLCEQDQQMPVEAPSLRAKTLWAALAFVPASLLYGVTAQLCLDFPPIPLLWIIPLAIYLISFIVAFSSGFQSLRRSAKLLPTVVVATLFIFWTVGASGVVWIGAMKLLCFAFIAIAFHVEVARRRPPSSSLTTFYIWISLGGIAAGIANTIIAPVILSWYWEFPLTLVLAATLLPEMKGAERKPLNQKSFFALVVGLCIAGVVLRSLPLSDPEHIRLAFIILCSLVALRSPLRIAPVVLSLLSIPLAMSWGMNHEIYRGRSFFGTYRVVGTVNSHKLVHGTTVHGEERFDDAYLRTHPQGYYGAIRPVFEQFAKEPDARFAVVGLGAGMIGCFPAASQTVDFFEIDPLVARIANRTDLFTFLQECPARKEIILGDARLTLRNAAPHAYSIIVLDAFSGDSIPVHLLTREAFAEYRQKLKPDGLLMVHISNRFFDLAPIVSASAVRDGLTTFTLFNQPTPAEASRGRSTSYWVLVAPTSTKAQFEAIGWTAYGGQKRPWTDDHSTLLDAVVWRAVLAGNQ